VIIVAHQVVVLCLRYIVENMDEEQILAIDRAGDVANASVTDYRFDPAIGRDGGLALVAYNRVTAIEQDDEAEVTTESSSPVAVRG
jgi:broad specificity phosphatase PhoE